MANFSAAGKGDRNRSNTQAFRDGYDQIDWGKKEEGPCVEVSAVAPLLLPPTPYTIEAYWSFLTYVYDRVITLLEGIPYDAEGDIAPCDMELVNWDLMALAADIRKETVRIHRVISFIQ